MAICLSALLGAGQFLTPWLELKLASSRRSCEVWVSAEAAPCSLLTPHLQKQSTAHQWKEERKGMGR